ncbi:TetR/AcrR family transcriptional regulator [Rhizobium sp. 007]|uniref:TetR/AcrR family transcriptional regulator n=1 Tax=Rhizobium sp. 007 TaxID=2785056 RepID=UPI00188F78B9|nr:TetR/AcrR family transcriptional regulator [Rhizobium sp. 007]QPB22299.1 TetR family transcriptional regulator [Rhizobium sp. 007]
MTPVEFQRARRPEQKEERRVHLLEVTRALLSENSGTPVFGLNELARHAGMTKSNVYRYFESREAVLLELLREEGDLWYEALGAELSALSHPIALEEIAEAVARTATARPLLGHLTSIMPSIIEHNVSIESVREFKTSSLQLLQDAARFLHERAPYLSISACEEFIHRTIISITGLWPLSHPSPVTAVVLEAPELAAFRYSFHDELARVLLLLLRGLSQESTNQAG